MPAAVAVPLITGAASAGASIVGGKLQSNAMRDASNIEGKNTAQALADARAARQWQQAQYANYLERLRPYTQYGVNAGNTLNNLMRLSPYTQMANRGQAPAPRVPAPVPPMPVPPIGRQE